MNLEASESNLIFSKVWGKVNSEVIRTVKEEVSVFDGGESRVTQYEKTQKEWVITGAANEPYEIGDDKNGITLDELKEALAKREIYLAEVKKKNDEYQASKAAPSVAKVGVSAQAGGFNF